MINPTALLAKHREAERVLTLIQKAEERIQTKEKHIREHGRFIGDFFEKQKLFRWLGHSQAAKERLIERYNKIKL